MEVTGPVCRRWSTRLARDEADVGGAALIEAMNPVMADNSAAAVPSTEVEATDFADLHKVARWWSLWHCSCRVKPLHSGHT